MTVRKNPRNSNLYKNQIGVSGAGVTRGGVREGMSGTQEYEKLDLVIV